MILSLRVITLRGNPVFKFLKLSADTPDSLTRAVRGHGNFAEYTPIFLILLFLAEQQGIDALILNLSGGGFIVGRILHGYAFGFSNYSPIGRIGGTVCTLLSLILILIAGVFNLFIIDHHL